VVRRGPRSRSQILDLLGVGVLARFLALAPLACGADAAALDPSDAGASEVGPDAQAVDGQDAGDDGLPGDAAAAPALGAASFMEFWHNRQRLEQQRRHDCFKFPPWMAARAGSADAEAAAQMESLDQGRSAFVPARAQTCLQALAELSCAALLTRFGEGAPVAACENVLEPKIAAAGACTHDAECLDGAHMSCTDGDDEGGNPDAGSASCGRRCMPRLPAGGNCANGRGCEPGSTCRVIDPLGAVPSFRCTPLPGLGEACDPLCAEGLFCSRSTSDGWEGTDHGVCRARVEGGGCQNDWHCPWPLFCDRPAPAIEGKCAPRRGLLNQTCVPGRGDCPLGSACSSAMPGGFVCRAWPTVGQACGHLASAAPGSEFMGCARGICDVAAGSTRGICVAYRSLGQSCQGSVQCDAGLVCQQTRAGVGNTCQLADAVGGQAGDPCDFWNRCADGQRCRQGQCEANPPARAGCRDPGASLGVAGARVLGVDGVPPTGSFAQVLLHGPASRQSTALGRRIATLEPWKGRLYVGYGDYDANTGPIVISSIDPATCAAPAGAGGPAICAPAVEELTFATEAVALYRPINDALYAPAIDPRGADLVAYARGAPWAPGGAFLATHAFDMASRDGQDLWVVGSAGMDAVAWRSGDGGATWQEGGRESSGRGLFSRYYFAASLNDKLYLQISPAEIGQSRVFDGATWAPGPNLLPLGGQGWNPRRFGQQLIYATWQPIGALGSALMSFDGTTPRSALPGEVLDFAVTGDAVYVLGSDRRIQRSRDLRHWWVLALAPAGARSLAVAGGQLFVGGTEGRIFVLQIPP
jgi:hypothetical protein